MRAFAVVTCIAALVGFVLWLFGPKSEGTFGLTVGGGTQAAITSIDDTSPLRHDGVRVGDIIRFDRMPIAQRVNVTEAVAGVAATIAVERNGGVATFTEVARPAPAPRPAREVPVWILTLIYAAMTVLIAWRAPRGRLRTVIMLVVATLVIASAAYSYQDSIYSPLASAALHVTAALAILTFTVSAFTFIVIFPPRSTVTLRWVRAVGFPLTVAATVLLVFADGINYAFRLFPFDVTRFGLYCTVLAFAVWIVGIVEGTFSAGRSYRTPALVAGSTLIVLAVVNIAWSLTTLFGWNAAWEGYLEWLQWASGFGMSYAVLRHRLLDLNLAISRAAIFSVVSLSLIAIFVLAEWLLVTIAERAVGSDFGENGKTALTAFIALCLGLSARRIHQVIEHRLNRLFFAKRYRALEDLRRFSLETDAATDASALLELTLNALRRDLDAQYAALYTGMPESGYVATGTGTALPLRLDENEEVVLRLRRWGEAFVVDNESHRLAGAYVCPMTLRGRLYGFAICGPKIDRTGYLPDERETVAALTHRVGITYEWLTRGATAQAAR
ncbi:MAG TPA: hypothetical protein VMF61_11435 [Candidatus Acidoferrales bacterium]|nr:hypothetical protein [Candidatus Acidoferrales bacterium]